MKCLAKNNKGKRCKNDGSLKKLGFCKDHGIIKSDWYFIDNPFLKGSISLIILAIMAILTTVVDWEIEDRYSKWKKGNPESDSINEDSGNPDDFQVLILPFGSSDFCEGEKVLCERELKRYFKTVVGRDSLSPINVVVDQSVDNMELIQSPDELIRLGNEHNADLMIWGDYSRRCSWDSTKIVINYAVFDEYASKYGGISKTIDAFEGTVKNVSQLAAGELVGDLKDIVFWSLGVREALFKRNFEKGIKLLEQVDASKNEEYGEYYHLLAYCYQNIARNDKAVEYYSIATQVDSTNFWPYNNRGTIFMSEGKLDMAVEDFVTGIKISNGENPNLYLNFSTALMQLGSSEESAYFLELALQLDPDFQDALLARAKFLSIAGQKRKALEDLQRASKNGETSLVLLEFAQFYFFEQDYDLAMLYLERAQNRPNTMQENPYSHDLNAELKYLILRVKILESTNPSSPEIANLIGRIKSIHGDSNANGISILSYGGYLTVDYNK